MVKGKLTSKVIKTLQNYYRIAIRRTKNTSLLLGSSSVVSCHTCFSNCDGIHLSVLFQPCPAVAEALKSSNDGNDDEVNASNDGAFN